jgi:hypothetical protein
MKPAAGVRTRADNNGAWLPPRPFRSNELEAGDSTHAIFFFDGTMAYQVAAAPEGIQHFKTVSVYYESEAGFWAVPFDATRYPVGNGRQDNNDEEDEEDDAQGDPDPNAEYTWVDWKKMRFNWDDDTNEPAYRSWIVIGGQHHQLQAQRPDQMAWLRQILPNRYHASQERNTPYTQYAALNGDLGLLLALVAFSVRPRNVAEAVTTCLTGNGWREHNHTAGRGCMWFSSRSDGPNANGSQGPRSAG